MARFSLALSRSRSRSTLQTKNAKTIIILQKKNIHLLHNIIISWVNCFLYYNFIANFRCEYKQRGRKIVANGKYKLYIFDVQCYKVAFFFVDFIAKLPPFFTRENIMKR